ncbi:MAG: Hydantoinase B/oxoprolinase [Gammaproteobacteria bacterium]|nr:Hydantoinase B/oxoprolinase [Gammaproteobacteria bacterium]
MVFSQSGGGGWGDPLDRDPQAVLDEVLDEYISVEGAGQDYGVIIDTQKWVVRIEETVRELAHRKAQPGPKNRAA